MRNNKHYNHWDNTEDDDIFDRIEKDKPSRKAIAIGVIILVSVVLGALRLWNVFQRP